MLTLFGKKRQQNEDVHVTSGLAMVRWLIYHDGLANQNSQIALSSDLVFSNVTYTSDISELAQHNKHFHTAVKWSFGGRFNSYEDASVRD